MKIPYSCRYSKPLKNTKQKKKLKNFKNGFQTGKNLAIEYPLGNLRNTSNLNSITLDYYILNFTHHKSNKLISIVGFTSTLGLANYEICVVGIFNS